MFDFPGIIFLALFDEMVDFFLLFAFVLKIDIYVRQMFPVDKFFCYFCHPLFVVWKSLDNFFLYNTVLTKLDVLGDYISRFFN